MATTIHRPVKTGSIGKIDKWGFGSSASVVSYPTLGIDHCVTTSTTGGVRYPSIDGVSPKFHGRPEYAPLQAWGTYSPTYDLPDGRVIVAVMLDGERCFEELRLSVDKPM